MFKTNSSSLRIEKLDLANYIEGDDIFNSEFLYRLNNLSDEDFNYHEITRYERRIDLISERIYNDKKYADILLFINKISINDLALGVVLKYPRKNVIDALIQEL
jgi:hypothetical protein